MTGLRHADPAPAAHAGWAALDAELACWAEAGRVATLWWRDDDAARPTPALDRLLALRRGFDVPLALAVIPDAATEELADRLAPEDRVDPLQHGYRHRNHAPPGEKKAELGAHRPPEIVLADIAAGARRMEALFARARPVLVPPWNRIAPSLCERLAGLGLGGLSGHGARPACTAAPGLEQANTHVDLIDWHGTRGFVGVERAIADIVGQLAARRRDGADGAEPVGILTHHLAHDEGCWRFLEALFSRVGGRRAVRVAGATELFGLPA